MKYTSDIQWPIDNLPKICVHSLDRDYYSQFYEEDQYCTCGNNDWISSMLTICVIDNQVTLPPRRIHRCSLCNELRKSKIKKQFNEIIESSSSILKTLLQKTKSEYECLWILKNMIANLEILIQKKKIEDNQEEKILNLEKFCNEIKIDKNLMLEMVRKMSHDNISKHA